MTLLVGFPALLTGFLPPMGGHYSITLTAIAGCGVAGCHGCAVQQPCLLPPQARLHTAQPWHPRGLRRARAVRQRCRPTCLPAGRFGFPFGWAQGWAQGRLRCAQGDGRATGGQVTSISNHARSAARVHAIVGREGERVARYSFSGTGTYSGRTQHRTGQGTLASHAGWTRNESEPFRWMSNRT